MNDSMVRYYRLSRNRDLLYTNKVDSGIIEHTHRRWTLGFVLKGKRKFNIQGNNFEINENDCYIIPPNRPHSLERGVNRTEAIVISLPNKTRENADFEKIMRGCYSREHKIRKVKAAYGLPPVRLIRQNRMLHATALICKGYSQADAALEAGFFDQSHFCRCFGSWWGMTPRELIKAAQNIN